MTDLDKALAILAATNDGQDLPIQQQYVVMAAQTAELGRDTGVRLVFEHSWEQARIQSADTENDL